MENHKVFYGQRSHRIRTAFSIAEFHLNNTGRERFDNRSDLSTDKTILRRIDEKSNDCEVFYQLHNPS